ncbi:hypothetical protein GFC30_2366 [Anoxybacillus amylolyticus]|uniref:Uncharacterized protein n=2 Tax=Anoxybacteroides amylolyticum TaxID=294699 RepID=A0A167TE12_9BACL|nr:hypothetical protein GFC30_2366 [Anoxybacillus amylolyticus]
MSGEKKAIQLEQKVIHLKSEIEKYKEILSSLQFDEQIDLLNKQLEQLHIENEKLKEAYKRYEEIMLTQSDEIHRLAHELEQLKNAQRLFYNEIQNEQFKLKKQLETNDQQTQAFFDAYSQKQKEFEKEIKTIFAYMHTLEKEISAHHDQLTDYTSLRPVLTSWMERMKDMEKKYDFFEKNSEKLLQQFEGLSEETVAQKKETDDLKDEVRTLGQKTSMIEKILPELDKEQQKDIAVLQKQLLRQQVKIEELLEQTAHFANEMEKIFHQLAELAKRTEKKREEGLNLDITEMKEMLAHVIQLLATPKQIAPEAGKESSPPSKTTTGSSMNSFLKLQQFMDETNQSIVVSPINQKKQGLSQKPPLVKRARIEPPTSQNTRPPIRYKQTGEDDDQLPNLILRDKHNEEPLFHPPFSSIAPLYTQNNEEELFVSLHRHNSVKTDDEQKETDTVILEKNELDLTVASDIVQTESALATEKQSLYNSHSPLPSETNSHEEKKKSWLLSLFKKAKT